MAAHFFLTFPFCKINLYKSLSTSRCMRAPQLHLSHIWFECESCESIKIDYESWIVSCTCFLCVARFQTFASCISLYFLILLSLQFFILTNNILHRRHVNNHVLCWVSWNPSKLYQSIDRGRKPKVGDQFRVLQFGKNISYKHTEWEVS